jgi:glycosyltransferase involved in cell wall biosynthesis
VLCRFELPTDYLLYPAQFWAHKNHVNLLLALKRLNEQGLRMPLVLVGSNKGNVETVKQCAASLGISDQMRILGFVSVDELVALYRGAFCLVYVSLFGPENLPPLEAFALGCPVIASDVPGSEEQLGDAALRVDAKNPNAIAEAVRYIRQNPQIRDDLVHRGKARAQKWTGAEFVRGVYAVLDGLSPIIRCWRLLDAPQRARTNDAS